jgi:hypothetical protein
MVPKQSPGPECISDTLIPDKQNGENTTHSIDIFSLSSIHWILGNMMIII